RGDAMLYHTQAGPAVSERYGYTPWGEYAGTMITPYQPLYNGRDGVLPDPTFNHHVYGDYTMGARTYNATLGRFRQVDPLPAQDGTADTAYSYASNDPINRVDPDGRASKPRLPGYVSISLKG